ncbi:MAG: type II toxin-antitoxin system RelE/ParE family toxin [Candidatus Marinimicrobia bacterium]|nr:type II toxin-antitoxin system RelE/ParE family toxin [Candidatus Neomarinimicrobiota bacterium]
MVKTYEVYVIEDAEKDLFDIYSYISRNDSIESAEDIFDAIQKSCLSLSTLPARGHVPPELERVGIFEYLEIHFKPYRIIYQVRKNEIFIHCILDGRRSLEELLQERLIRV